MNEFLTKGLEQAPILVLFLAAGGWLIKTFLRHISTLMDDHSLVMKEVLDRNTAALEASTETLGAAKEALRSRSPQ